MAISAQQVIGKAQILLQDLGATRWDIPTLLGWLNEGQHALALAKPSMVTRSVTHNLVRGTRQALPEGAFQLSRVVRNMAGDAPGRAVRLVDRAMLDAMHPDWHDASRFRYERSARHFAYDEADPTTFWVFPGNTGDGAVELLAAFLPAPLTSATDSLNLPDEYASPLLDWVLYRCFSEDSDLAGAGERAAGHYQMCYAALGVKGEGEFAVGPNGGPDR